MIGVRNTKCSTKFPNRVATSIKYRFSFLSSLYSFFSRFARQNGSRRSSLSRPREGRDCQPFVRGRPCLAGSPPPSSRRFTDRELVAAEESESGRNLCVPSARSFSLPLPLLLFLSSFPSLSLSAGKVDLSSGRSYYLLFSLSTIRGRFHPVKPST